VVLKDEVAIVRNRGSKERHCAEAVRQGRESNSATQHSIQILHPEAHRASENCFSTSKAYTMMV
jgi:hypothetical protein